MTGAEITAAGLSGPELLIRFLSDDDDDDEGVVRDRSKQCPSSQWGKNSWSYGISFNPYHLCTVGCSSS